MLWVCRAGQSAKFFDTCMENNVITIPWQGFNFDLSDYSALADFRKIVEIEMESKNRTSVSNWAIQLYSFCKVMDIGDCVLIPGVKSKLYTLGEIMGNYYYDEAFPEIHHFRKIKVCCENIPRETFPQNIQYSLGTFRTIFRPSHEDEIISLINNWSNDGGKKHG